MLLYLRQQGQLSRKGLAEFGTFIKVRKLQERYNFMLCGVEIRVDHNCVTVHFSFQRNYLGWLTQTKVISLKTQLHAFNARWKRLSQRSFKDRYLTGIRFTPAFSVYSRGILFRVCAYVRIKLDRFWG